MKTDKEIICDLCTKAWAHGTVSDENLVMEKAGGCPGPYDLEEQITVQCKVRKSIGVVGEGKTESYDVCIECWNRKITNLFEAHGASPHVEL